MSVLRYLRTLRHLKLQQIYGRLFFRLQRPYIDTRIAPQRRDVVQPWVIPLRRSPSLLGPYRVRFLNHEALIELPSHWNHPKYEKLWLYNLHYFDDLNAAEADLREAWHRQLVSCWIRDNPPAVGVGWDPYPLSLRIVNWIKWSLAGVPLEAVWCNSLAIQTRFLEKRLEWHLLGNHLLANAKALIFAGLFLKGSEANGWLARGLAIWEEQLAEQVLPDGGNFERSPMYHAIILEDLLDLLNIARTFDGVARTTQAHWEKVSLRMLQWMKTMTHPDGQIAFFNDAALGIAGTAADLEGYAARLGIPPRATAFGLLTWLQSSGYVRLADGEAVALLDVAAIGPDYLPGHAHADTLSFELSLGRERVVVNGGTSVYGDGPQRQRERSTAAHSTVEIDGENSSEVWAGFRVGRRARICTLEVDEQPNGATVTAAHDGYRARPGRPLHRRTWRFEKNRLVISDDVQGRVDTARARFHLGPGVTAICEPSGRCGTLLLSSGNRLSWQSSVPAVLEASEWHPEFGLTVSTYQLSMTFTEHLETEFSW